MIALIVVILLVVWASSIKSYLREAFSGDWMRFDEPQEPEMDNSEFDWGHDVKYRTEDDYE